MINPWYDILCFCKSFNLCQLSFFFPFSNLSAGVLRYCLKDWTLVDFFFYSFSKDAYNRSIVSKEGNAVELAEKKD